MLPPPLVVVVVVDVVTGIVVVVVVDVVPGHGQLRTTDWPTAFFRQMSASVAVTGSVPLGAQMHSGEQVCEPTAARRMNRQSLAVGLAPEVTGWAHCASAKPAVKIRATVMLIERLSVLRIMTYSRGT
jgi:hypothetical protein